MSTLSTPSSNFPPVQPAPPKEPRKTRRYLWFFPFLIIAMLIIIIIAIRSQLQPFKQQLQNYSLTGTVPSPTNSITDTPTPEFSPSPTIGATASALPTLWTPYQNTQYFPGLGISLIFPYGWTVKYRQTPGIINPLYNFLTSIEFDFLPAAEKIDPDAKDSMGWGSLSISVYNRIASINEWITKTFPPDKNKLLPYPDGTIGNFPAYLIAPRKDLDSNDPLNYSFTPRDVIIGNRYIYELNFSQNGKGDYKNTIKRAIYPFFHFD